MSVYSITFSPTGGTQKVMDILGAEFKVTNKVDLTQRKSFSNVKLTSNDICLIGMPSYGGRAPRVAIERLKQIQGNGAKTVLVAVIGNRAFEDTLLEMKNEAEACGFSVQAAICANAEHSIFRKFGAGRPDAKDKEELKIYAQTIMNKIRLLSGDHITVPGNYPYKPFGGVSLIPKAGVRCMGCGFCAEGCPVGAIAITSPNETDESKCISCMRCVSVCPQKTRQVNPDILGAIEAKMAAVCTDRKKNELYV